MQVVPLQAYLIRNPQLPSGYNASRMPRAAWNNVIGNDSPDSHLLYFLLYFLPWYLWRAFSEWRISSDKLSRPSGGVRTGPSLSVVSGDLESSDKTFLVETVLISGP